MQSRRDFLRTTALVAGAVSLGVILQACGGGAGAPASSAAVPPAGSAGASAKPAGSTAASAKPAGSSSAGGSAAGKPGAAGKLTVSYGSVAGSFWPLWMAKEGGFDKYGITVDMPLIETNAAVAAVISKQVDSMEVS